MGSNVAEVYRWERLYADPKDKSPTGRELYVLSSLRGNKPFYFQLPFEGVVLKVPDVKGPDPDFGYHLFVSCPNHHRDLVLDRGEVILELNGHKGYGRRFILSGGEIESHPNQLSEGWEEDEDEYDPLSEGEALSNFKKVLKYKRSVEHSEGLPEELRNNLLLMFGKLEQKLQES